MKIAVPSFLKRSPQNFSDLETQLEAALQPVAPREAYISGLRRKLSAQWETAKAVESPDTRDILLLIGAGFLSGLMVLVLSIRVVLTLIATIGLLYQFKRQLNEEKSTQLPPAV